MNTADGHLTVEVCQQTSVPVVGLIKAAAVPADSPIGRAVEPEEIAGTVLFLASDMARP